MAEQLALDQGGASAPQSTTTKRAGRPRARWMASASGPCRCRSRPRAGWWCRRSRCAAEARRAGAWPRWRRSCRRTAATERSARGSARRGSRSAAATGRAGAPRRATERPSRPARHRRSAVLAPQVPDLEASAGDPDGAVVARDGRVADLEVITRRASDGQLGSVGDAPLAGRRTRDHAAGKALKDVFELLDMAARSCRGLIPGLLHCRRKSFVAQAHRLLLPGRIPQCTRHSRVPTNVPSLVTPPTCALLPHLL